MCNHNSLDSNYFFHFYFLFFLFSLLKPNKGKQHFFPHFPLPFSILLIFTLTKLSARVETLEQKSIQLEKILAILKFGSENTKGFNTVPDAVPIWPAVRYISDTGQYQYTVSSLSLFFIFINK